MTYRLASLVATALSLMLTACASGYKQFYVQAPAGTPDQIASRRASPPPQTPALERASFGDSKAIYEAYAKRGYIVVGTSMFNSGSNESERGAVDQGKAVGADLVLIFYPKYTGSVTSSVPLTTPTTSTSYSSGSATVYGYGGPVTAYGNSTTTTYGSSTTYVPVTVNRSDYGAVYFVKMRTTLGAHFRDLNDSERQELQSNRGAVITIVIDDSPAFYSDILAGDVVLSIDGSPVVNTASILELLRNNKGQKIVMKLSRRGKTLEKLIQLN